ncbi:unnamed protein product, partial [Meganyctiphanes norvegica]
NTHTAGNHWYYYAAGAVGILVVVCWVSLAVFCYKKRNKTHADDEAELNTIPAQNGRRGSAHDSENSLYAATAPDIAQLRNSTHNSENSLYGTMASEAVPNQNPVQFNFI